MKLTINILLISCFVLNAQAQIQEATTAYYQQQWKTAQDYFEEYLSENGGDSLIYFRLGRIHYELNDLAGSKSYFNKATTAGFPASFISFEEAKIHLLENDLTGAITSLNKGGDLGLRNFMRLTNDTLFAPLRTLDSWDSVISKIELNTYPCLKAKEKRHFDFWLGDWNVFSGTRKVGENRITRANGGCAIHENYTTYPGDYTGQSLNFFDPSDGLWHQHWVGSSGDISNYTEIDKSDGMIKFEATSTNPGGDKVLNRMTFTLLENGDVRQFIEASTDNASTWTTAFDGLYVKKQADR